MYSATFVSENVRSLFVKGRNLLGELVGN